MSRVIFTFADGRRTVDSSVSDPLQEMHDLSRVSEAISQTWTQCPMIAAAEASSNDNLWVSVKASLDDYKNALRKLDTKQKKFRTWMRWWSRHSTGGSEFGVQLYFEDYHQTVVANYGTAYRFCTIIDRGRMRHIETIMNFKLARIKYDSNSLYTFSISSFFIVYHILSGLGSSGTTYQPIYYKVHSMGVKLF